MGKFLASNILRADGYFNKMTYWCLMIVIIIPFLVICHYFYRLIDYAPYLAVDDSLANISVGLSNLHRYGFLASPLQPPFGASRADVFFNYGPLTFWIGAALDWLFGTSYSVQRTIHLLGLVLISGTAFIYFRRFSLAGVGLFVLLLTQLFWLNHWPMFRPDIIVATCGVMTTAIFCIACQTDKKWSWALSGLLAATTAVTHQIAWAFIPASFIIWLWVRISFPAETDSKGILRSQYFTSFLCLSLGLMLGGFIYFLAIHFKIFDLIALLKAYPKLVASDLGYFKVFSIHFRSSWSGFTPSQVVLLYIPYLIGVILLLTAPYFKPDIKRLLISILLPPIALCVAYQLSLGLYTNFHSGYVLLTQSLTIWVVVAAITSCIILSKEIFQWLPLYLENGLRLAIIIPIMTHSYSHLKSSEAILADTNLKVSISDYLNESLKYLPLQARIWGDIRFGLGSGVTNNLIQTSEGLALASTFKSDYRDVIAPDFLIMSDQDLQAITSSVMNGNGSDTLLNSIQAMFPRHEYKLFRIVDAYPYSSTNIYQRVSGISEATLPPIINVYDPSHKQWVQQLGNHVSLRFQKTDPVVFEINKGGEKKANNSIEVESLSAGNYFITLTVSGDSSKDNVGLLLTTNTKKFTGQVFDVWPNISIAPYYGDEKSVYLIVRHNGGSLFISQISSIPSAQFEMASIQLIKGSSISSTEINLPPHTQWTIPAIDGKLVTNLDGTQTIIGDATQFGYQFVSSEIRVPKNSRIELKVDALVQAGTVGVGVLNQSMSKWIAQNNNLSPLVFETGQNEAVFIVFMNANMTNTEQKSMFTYKTGKLSIHSQGVYADVLSQCHASKVKDRPAFCNPTS